MNEMSLRFCAAFFCLIALTVSAQGQDSPSPAPFDVVIKGGTLYNGTGGKPRVTDSPTTTSSDKARESGRSLTARHPPGSARSLAIKA